MAILYCIFIFSLLQCVMCECEFYPEFLLCDSIADAVSSWTDEYNEFVILRSPDNFLPLSKNIREEIDSSTFRVSDNLKKLLIYYTLEDIGPNTFKSKFNYLEELGVEDNNLPILRSNSFSGLELTSLSLQRNNIKFIQRHAFKTSSATNLDLTNNNITVILKDTLPDKISDLRIEFNQLVYIEDDALPTTLFKLYLNNNNFIDIEHCGLVNMENLQMLYLNNNELLKIGVFPQIEWLNILRLSSNKIKSVNNLAFSKLPNLQLLDLSYNQIFILDGFLDYLSYLKFLYVENNLIPFITFTEKFPAKLVVFGYFGNPFSCKCLEEVQYFLFRRNITETYCEDFFDGRRPTCYTYKKTCDEFKSILIDSANNASVIQQLHEYKNFLKANSQSKCSVTVKSKSYFGLQQFNRNKGATYRKYAKLLTTLDKNHKI